MSARQNRDTGIRVGNIASSTGVAVGPGASASVHQSLPSRQAEVHELLQAFARTLGYYQDGVDDAEELRRTVGAAQAEVSSSSPVWSAIRRMLTAIAGSVAGVAALTDAINNIQAIVDRIAG